MSSKKITAVLALCCGSVLVHAQDKKLIKEGNSLYEQKKYKEAAAVYQQALQKNPANMPGMFNLGNALYLGNQKDAARNAMTATAKNAPDKLEKSGAQYNLGNTYMDDKKWDDAVNYYKQALRNNPQDADAKYNLSYAYTMMKKDQQNNKDKNKDQKNKDQQNKQNKDQQNKDQQKKDQQGKDNKDKDQQNKDQQNKDQQNKDNKDDQQGQHPEPKPGKLTEKQADQILNALQQEEKNLQEKKQKAKGVPVKMEKDW